MVFPLWTCISIYQLKFHLTRCLSPEIVEYFHKHVIVMCGTYLWQYLWWLNKSNHIYIKVDTPRFVDTMLRKWSLLLCLLLATQFLCPFLFIFPHQPEINKLGSSYFQVISPNKRWFLWPSLTVHCQNSVQLSKPQWPKGLMRTNVWISINFIHLMQYWDWFGQLSTVGNNSFGWNWLLQVEDYCDFIGIAITVILVSLYIDI